MNTPLGQDRDRFVQLWTRLRLGDGAAAAWKQIVVAYTERRRRYHNWDHILWCLRQFDSIWPKLSDYNTVEFAIYFHDVVYQPGASDNEERSVDVAMQHLQTGTFEMRNRVKILILDTKHLFTPGTDDGKYMADIDVSSMGDPAENARYVATVREEFLQFVSEEDYERGRRNFISEFLKKDRIYYTEHFHRMYEDTAKRNLAKQLEE